MPKCGMVASATAEIQLDLAVDRRKRTGGVHVEVSNSHRRPCFATARSARQCHINLQDQAERSGDPERERGEPRAAAAERPKLPPTPKAPLPPPGPTWGDFIGTQVAQSHRPIHRSTPCHVAPMSFTSGCRCSCSQAEPAMSDPIGHGTPPLGAAHAPKPPRPRAPCC